MRVDVAGAVPAILLEGAWKLYAEAFEELQWQAVQRHLMYRDEFDGVMADPRVDKYLALDDDGAVRGLATFTNDLDAVPLISPLYFARRWPAHFAEKRIRYIGFVAVAAGSEGAFRRMITAMYEVAHRERAVVAMDFCRHRTEVNRIADVVDLIVRRLPSPLRGHRMDEQTYWLYEFPEAA
jgi:hypothetical protein